MASLFASTVFSCWTPKRSQRGDPPAAFTLLRILVHQAVICSSALMSSSTPPTSSGPHTDGRQAKHERPRRKLRVLCHRTNAKVMINQTKGLRAAMGVEYAEFIFLDAPLPAAGPTDPVIERVHGQDAPFYVWWNAEGVEDLAENETKWIWSLENHAETLAFMDQKLIEIGPVDVVVGFSQGMGSVQSRDLMETPDGRPLLVPLPSIHLIGRADPFSEDSVLLADQFDSHCTMFPASPLKKMVVFHDEGHKFPSAKRHKALYDELAQRIYDHCYACDQEDASTALARL